MAQASKTRVERRNPEANYHKMGPAELRNLTPDFSWDNYFRNVNFPDIREVNVGQPEFFQALQDTWFASGIRQSLWLFPILYTLHILGVVILVGATSALDLRMLGLVMRDEPMPDLAALLRQLVV